MRWFRDDEWLTSAGYMAWRVAMNGVAPRWFRGYYGVEPGYPIVVLQSGGSTSLWAWLQTGGRREASHQEDESTSRSADIARVLEPSSV